MKKPSIDIPITKTKENQVPESIINSKTLIDSSNTPNFVLINKHNFNFPFFSDILVSYPLHKPLAKVVFTSFESLSNLVWLSRTFLICILALIQSAFTSSVYQIFLTTKTLYQKYHSLPGFRQTIQTSWKNILAFLSSPHNRELWWLDTKLNLKILRKQLLNLIQDIYYFVSKFYLISIVGVSIITLNSSFIGNLPGVEASLLGRYIFQNSQAENAQQDLASESETMITDTSARFTDEPTHKDEIVWIGEYLTTQDDTVSSVAKKFNLEVQTLRINNQLNNYQDDTALPANTELILPFVDGIIFKAEVELNLEEINKRIQNVDQNIYQEINSGIIPMGASKLDQGQYVFIPTKDYDTIFGSLNEYQESIKKQIKQAETVKNRLKYSFVARSQYIPTNSSEYLAVQEYFKTQDFIFPLKGSYRVSRCFVPRANHFAGDFPTKQGSPIYAIFDGVVENGFEPAGGNFIKLTNSRGDRGVYYHLSGFAHESKTSVVKGQIIGYSGGTPGSPGAGSATTGAHLHFEIHSKGVYLNPCLVYGL